MRLNCKSLNNLLGVATLLLALVGLTGCQTSQPQTGFQNYDASVGGSSAATGAQAPEGATSTQARPRSEGTDVFLVGDVVAVTFSGPTDPIPPHEERIKEDGTITLFLVGSVQAAGKTPGELQRDLQKAYENYYKTLVVTVRSFSRFYYVGGEVKKPGAQDYLGKTSVTKAIQAAGDFTDFARKKAIKVIRADGTSLTVNFNKLIEDPSLDPPIYPGDKVHVPRREFPWQ